MSLVALVACWRDITSYASLPFVVVMDVATQCALGGRGKKLVLEQLSELHKAQAVNHLSLTCIHIFTHTLQVI